MSNKSTIQAPKLPRVLDHLIWNDELEEEGYIRNGKFQNCNIESQNTKKVIWDSVVFSNVTFVGSSFPFAELTDVVFEECDLSNVDFSESILHRVVIKNCKLIGTNFSEAAIRNVLFENSVANYSSFGFANCKQIKYYQCSLRNADFYEAKMESLQLEDCQLEQVNFAGVALKGVDLSSNHFNSLVVSLELLKGCTVTKEQAISFAKLLGIVLADE